MWCWRSISRVDAGNINYAGDNLRTNILMVSPTDIFGLTLCYSFLWFSSSICSTTMFLVFVLRSQTYGDLPITFQMHGKNNFWKINMGRSRIFKSDSRNSLCGIPLDSESEFLTTISDNDSSWWVEVGNIFRSVRRQWRLESSVDSFRNQILGGIGGQFVDLKINS